MLFRSGAPALLGTATPAAAALAPASPEPAAAVMQRIGPRAEAGGAPRLALLSGGLESEDIPGPARSDRDMALDQRNDTLWDLVVHLRDYVEQLRAERHALREEARQLRTALAEATEEARALRAAQGAANSNELTASPPEVRATEAPRIGALPTRFH